MNLYFSSNHLPQLTDYSFKQRQQIIAIACQKFSPLQKFVVNIIKLCLIVPFFLLLATAENWYVIWPVLGILACYFIVLRPVSLFLVSQNLDKALGEFNRSTD